MKRELGSFERALLISDQYAPFHITGVLRLDGAPPQQVIRKALAILQGRHPFLSARLLYENGNGYFESLENPALPFRTLPRWNDDHWIQTVEVELAARIDLRSGPMFRCIYLYNESQPRAEIVLTISHPISDATSISHLLHELLVISASLADGIPVSVSQLLPSPSADSRFPESFRGWRMSLHTLRYIFGQMSDEIAYRIRTIGKKTPQVHKQPARGQVLSVQLPEEVIEPFAQRARKEGVTLNSALNAALLLSVNRNVYAGKKLPMQTFSFADLRQYIRPALHIENLACYISMLRYTVLISGEMDFWSLARDLHKRIYKSFKSGDKFVAATMAVSLMKFVTKYKAFRMGSTALSFNGTTPIQIQYGKIKVTGVHGFISALDLGPEIGAQAYLFNGQLFLDFSYPDADLTREGAKEVVEGVKEIVTSVIASGPVGDTKQSPA